MSSDGSEQEPPVCSARGCRNSAATALRWNNPKIHDAARRKTWLACAEHERSLADFLTARGFLREAEPLSDVSSGPSARPEG
jgi:hypothetical protein